MNIFGSKQFTRLNNVVATCLILFSVHTTFSQNFKIDSLTSVLTTLKKKNSHRVDVLNDLGYSFWIIDPDKSIEYGMDAISISSGISYKAGFARANRIVGVAFWSQGNWNKALQYLNRSQIAYENFNDMRGVANTTLNIGMVYADLSENDKAIKFFEDAIEGFEKLNLDGRIATSYTKMGTVLLKQQNYKDAKQYFLNALTIHSKNDFIYGISEVHNRLALLFLESNEKEQAFYHVKKSMELGKQVNDTHGLTSNLLIYGSLLMKLDRKKEAEIKLDSALELAASNNLKQFELKGYKLLIELYRDENRPYETIKFYDKYISLKDSLFNSKKSKQIAFLEIENEIEKKDRDLLESRLNERRGKLITLMLGIVIAIILIASTFIFIIARSRARKSQELAQKKEEHLSSLNELTQTELENSKLKRDKLQEQLAYRNKELTSFTLNFIQKNEIVKQLEKMINNIKKERAVNHTILINDLKKLIRKNISIDRDWENFNLFFDGLHTDFQDLVTERHPSLTKNDLKLCSLIRLNLSIKEIAGIMNISPESVKTARYRLKKKLDLQMDTELDDYLSKI
ncbi:MAG: tetratricopeptide repeat protein [Nonlabens sp.]